MTAPAVLLSAALAIVGFALGMLWGVEIERACGPAGRIGESPERPGAHDAARAVAWPRTGAGLEPKAPRRDEWTVN